MRIFAAFVSLFVGKSLTDTSSSFRAVNRRALSLFAVDYPHGYLETIEATVMAVRYSLRIEEVPVRMRERTTGRSSLTTGISLLFYTVKVVVASFHQPVSSKSRTTGGRPMIPLRVSIIAAVAAAALVLVVLEGQSAAAGSRSATRCSGS